MGALIASIIAGIMKGFVGPLFTFLGKKTDDKLAGAQSGMIADTAEYTAETQYQIAVQNAKIASNNNWGHAIAYDIVAWTAAIHVAGINLDSTFRLNWQIAKLPPPYDYFEQIVVSSLFVTTMLQGPINNLNTWLAKK